MEKETPNPERILFFNNFLDIYINYINNTFFDNELIKKYDLYVKKIIDSYIAITLKQKEKNLLNFQKYEELKDKLSKSIFKELKNFLPFEDELELRELFSSSNYIKLMKDDKDFLDNNSYNQEHYKNIISHI